ncbi:MAG TPA: hypothetical protein VLM05_15940 [Mycobacteriales bacterium]|nr:hypothetical protein [Mycobacteriales bacterium]
MTTSERFRRHLRTNGSRAVLGGVSTSAVVAGFLDATNRQWPLLGYVGLAVAVGAALLAWLGAPGLRLRVGAAVPAARPGPDRPRQLELVATGRSGPLRQIAAARCDDPVYGAGFRVLLEPSRPLLVIPSHHRDVAFDHELLLPLFVERGQRSRVEVDLVKLGLPIPPYTFARELPGGVHDSDHTLAVKDLMFLPELAAALGATDSPVMWPEHCVDPLLLSRRDLVVVGGPDTNFWHAALYEPIAREFARPASSVPLALGMRGPGELPTYGSRLLTAELADSGTVFPHSRRERVELDERLYPTHAMILACRNPFAAAAGRSHWCVFIAGTRSLGTSAGVLALTVMLRRMRADPEANFFSEVPTHSPRVRARISAALIRVVEVEQASLRRDGKVQPRQRRRMAPEGLDPHYSDSYVPTEVDLLAYGSGDSPQWTTLGRLGGDPP